MKLVLIKTHKGSDVGEEELLFDDIDEYLDFMKTYGVNMSLDEAAFDMQQKQVRFHVPVLSKDVH